MTNKFKHFNRITKKQSHNDDNLHVFENSLISKRSQTGGKFVDKGGWGCVVSPAIPCNTKTKKDKNISKMVSKIVKDADETVLNEIKISNILKKIDSKNKYYITYNKYCYLHKIPEDRKDIIGVHYTDDKLSKFTIITEQGDKDKKVCDIELALKPMNIIMNYAGYNLSKVIKTKLTEKNAKGVMHRLFLDNFKNYFKHLLLGIIKMHNNRIINHDIKPKNIMLNWDKTTNLMDVKYIDFGLSDLLTSEFCSNYENMNSKGTPYYLSPEIIITYYINKYNTMNDKYILYKIFYDINKYVLKSFNDINEIDLLGNLRVNIFILFNKIKKLYDNKKILNIYFGNEKNKFNGYLQKNDIYALGLSLFEVLTAHDDSGEFKKDKSLYNLLSRMIAFDPEKRFNGIQCLAHPYFHISK